MILQSDTMSLIARMMPASDLLIPGIRDNPGVKIIVRQRVKEGEYNRLLLKAASTGMNRIVKYLLDAGVDSNAKKCNYWCSPLHLAVWSGHTDIVKLLLDAGAYMDIKNSCNRTPLHLATMKNHTDIVKLLIERGADMEVKDKYGWNPLYFIKYHGLKPLTL